MVKAKLPSPPGAAAAPSERTAERSPEREALAAAIAAHDAAEATLKPQRDALARVEADLFKARRDEEVAELAVEEAAQVDASALADAYASGESIAPADVSALEDAQATLSKARRRVDELKSIATTLQERQARGFYPAVEDKRVKAAVRAVVAASPEVSRLVEDFQIAKRTYVSMFSTLRWLAFEEMISDRLKEIAPRGNETYFAPPDSAWEAAVARLAGDPDASLP